MRHSRLIATSLRALRCHALAALALLAMAAAPVSATVLTGCAEFGKPKTPTQIASGTPDQTAMNGFTAEFSRTVFSRIGRVIEFRDLPFARCMKLVADGEIDFALGPYYSEDRARIYAFSVPFRTLTPQVFQRADSPIRIASIAELKGHRGCGMSGSSYAHYGLRPGDIDQGATSYAGLILKLKSGRCDYIVEELQVIHGTENGRYRGDTELRHHEIAGATAPSRHFVSAKGGRGEALLPALNEKIEDMRRRGEILEIWKRTEGDKPF